MVRKVISLLFVFVLLLSTLCVAAEAESYQAFEGTISSTYLTYFRDILPNIRLDEHYVVFRSGQNEYKMIVGDLLYNNGYFSTTDVCSVYSFENSGNYNNYTTYKVSSLNDFTLSVGDKIVYSDLGNFPQLEERGQKYETLATLLISIALLCIVIGRIFTHR